MRLGISLGINRPQWAAGEGGGGDAASVQSTLTVPAGTVSSDLTSFPVFVRLSDMPSSFWAATALRSDGGNIRVRTPAEALVPIDLVWFDQTAEDGLVVFLAASVLAGSDNEWAVWVETADTEGLAVDDENGRNAVWAGYEAVTLLGGLANRTGGATPSVAVGAVQEFDGADVVLFEETAVSPDINGHQGVATDGTHYYVFDSNAIRKYDLSWSLVTENTDPQGDAGTTTNLTDGFFHDGTIYVGSDGWMTLWDPSDLSFISRFAAASGAASHGSAQCLHHDGTSIVSTPYPSATALNNFSFDGTAIGTITLSATIAEAQGITFWGGYYWINSDALDRTYKVATDGTILSERVWGRVASAAYEGIDGAGNTLLVLTDDGAVETVRTIEPVYPGLAAGGGAAFVDGDSVITVAVDAPGTQWSMAASFQPADDVQRGIIGLSGGGLFAKAVVDDGNNLGCFDTNDSWVYCSPTADPDKNLFHRVHVVYDGTSARHVYSNGGSKGTDATITGGGASADTLFIGAGNTIATVEGWRGAIAIAYLRAGVLSDAWVAAEYAALNDPANFVLGLPAAPGTLARTQAGLLFRDDFTRADGAVGADWSVEVGTWAISSNELRNDVAANGERIRCVGFSARGEQTVQVKYRRSGTTSSYHGYIFARNDAGDGYVWQPSASGDNIYRVDNWAFTSIASRAASITSAVGPWTLKLSVADGSQKASVNGGAALASADTTHDAVDGTSGLRTGAAGGAIDVFYDEKVVVASDFVTVSGLPTGYKVRVVGSGIADATESGGTATVDTGTTEIPFDGWPLLVVLNAADEIVALYTENGVYPGDAYTFTAP